MAHSLTAKKRHRQSLKLQQRNRAVRTEARSAVRKARELIAAGSAEEASKAVREASAILERASSKGVLHRNNATRRKTRLVHGLQKIGKAATPEAPKARKTATKSTRSRAKKS